jgi:Fe-Mn family superoxide dismutase
MIMDRHTFDRRDFLRGLAGSAVVLAGLSGTMAEGAPPDSAGQTLSSQSDLQRYTGLIGTLKGFSATIIREHLALLERYRHKLSELESQDRTIDLALADPIASRWRDHVLSYVELQNAVRLHELYFDSLTPKDVHIGQRVSKALKETFGSFDQWWVKFRATAIAVRAWGVFAWDHYTRRMVICGLDRDSDWPLGLDPLLVVDMAEHAYVLDFIGRPMAYLDAWLARVNWTVVEARLVKASAE